MTSKVVSATEIASVGPGTRLIVLGALALFVGLFGLGLTAFGPSFAIGVRSAIGFGLAAAFLPIAALTLRASLKMNGFSLGLIGRALVCAALFFLVLTRGAPHNNPHLYAAFETAGVLGLALAVAATVVFGVFLALLMMRNRPLEDLESFCRPWFNMGVLTLCLLAVVATAAPVLNAWDQPSWSDASTYDRLAHAIAVGDLPAGRSDYMPVYQFGSAALYWVFGHFFFVPQIVNLILAGVTVMLVALSAKALFQSAGAGFVAGLLASSHDYLRYTPNMMTIENWYVPALALALYCAVRLLIAPTALKAVLLALAVGLLFGIRVQGAFFCAFLILTPLFASQLSIAIRLRYCVLAGVVFVATLTPWTIRNYVQDGRISPGTTQAAGQMVYTTNARAFYGIRRGFGTDQIRREWTQKYPDTEERKAAMSRHGWLLPLTDPKLVWLEAVPWRALAFYGLLPPGVWDNDGVRPTNWRTEGLAYALQVGPVGMLLLASLIGIIYVRPRRMAVFLLGTIAANLAIIVFAGFSEPRVSYPVFPMHMLLAAAPFAGLGTRPVFVSPATNDNQSSSYPAAVAIGLVIAFIVIALVSRSLFGSAHAYRPLTAKTVVDPSVRIDETIPDLTCTPAAAGEASEQGDFRVAPRRVRMRVIATNYHFPVKYYGLASGDSGTALRGYPKFASSTSQPIYFEARLAPEACPGLSERHNKAIVGLAVEGARTNQLLREGDLIEFEGILQGESVTERTHWYWIAADSVSVIQSPHRIN